MQQILDQIKEKAPSFSTIRESQIALDRISIKSPKSNKKTSLARKLPTKPRYYRLKHLHLAMQLFILSIHNYGQERRKNER